MLTQWESLKKSKKKKKTQNNTLLVKYEELSNLGIAADIVKNYDTQLNLV